MATDPSFVEFVLDQLRSVPEVRAQKMFGEYGLYCRERVVALICDDQVFLKITDVGKERLGVRAKEALPYPGAKLWFVLDGDTLENADRFAELIDKTADVVPKAVAKKAAAKKAAAKKPAAKKAAAKKPAAKKPAAKKPAAKKPAAKKPAAKK